MIRRLLKKTQSRKLSWSGTAKTYSWAAIVPTHKPEDKTYRLIIDLLQYNPDLQIVIVDDSTPLNNDTRPVLNKLKKLAQTSGRTTYLRTPVNTLKAGAINFGIDHLLHAAKTVQVVFVLDDDVQIDQHTISIMADQLYSQPKIGAVCSQAYISNKNMNILTRLQGLEYHGFNTTKIADNTLFRGPLVAQGMLTAFRMTAIKQVKGFTQNHLIEDYDITVRLKKAGWLIRMADQAHAWTEAPSTFEAFWKQRVRWSFGGLRVVRENLHNPLLVFQDLFGHSLFLLTTILVVLAYTLPRSVDQHPELIIALLVITVFNLAMSYVYGIFVMKTYPNRDVWDWIIKLSLIPEFIYGNIASLILVGSYIFFIYSKGVSKIAYHLPLFKTPYSLGLALFQKLGYSATWGTR